MKARGERIAALTAYDVTFARMVEQAGVDLVLVGDSLGQVVLGYDSTVPVTLDDMIHHGRAVRRGAPNSFLVIDMPFLTYQVTPEEALRNCGRVLQETGADAVKLEGGGPPVLDAIRKVVAAGIPVMGHLGLTPQSVAALGGYRVQGREPAAAQRILAQADDLEGAGCFALVLELVPAPLAGQVTEAVGIPTIGIGAGVGCDGQVLVTYDALGLNPGFRPRFLRTFADLATEADRGIRSYIEAVRSGEYPDADHSFEADS
jgi:3-methyl-2-oxobutanoate hydroxymethyltransferase